MSAWSRASKCLLAALGFGVAMAVVKGSGSGVRDALGNLSAPWVVLPFWAGSRYARPWQGALAGLATVAAEFLAFYAAEAVILPLGPHPWWVDLRLTMGTFNVYEQWGLAAGTAFGLLGALWTSRGWRAGPLGIGAAFLLEPALVWALWRAGVWGGGELLLAHAWMWVAELAVGAALIVAVARRAPSVAATAH